MMKLFVFSFVVALISASDVGIRVQDCGSKAGKFSSITVSGCTDQQPVCVLKRRTNTTIDITFTPFEDLKKVTTVVHGIVAGVPVPFNVPDPEACDTCLKCPLSANTSYDYRATLPIARFYPTIQLIVKWELQDELARDIVCIKLTAKIQ